MMCSPLTRVTDVKTLKVVDIALKFGGVKALRGVNFVVDHAEIVAIIGPNGAGKTCLINCVNGFYRPQAGHIYYGDQEITHMSPDAIAMLRISRTFQNIELYSELTTLDNIMAGRHFHIKSNFLANAIYFGPARREETRHRRRVEEIVDFLELGPIRKKPVGTLPYGLRKRVELGRALALEPSILILDEPMAGMNLEEKEKMIRFIIDIYELRRIPIILIEHDMEVVMDISDRIVVLNFGEKIAEGKPEEIKVNPLVVEAYLG